VKHTLFLDGIMQDYLSNVMSLVHLQTLATFIWKHNTKFRMAINAGVCISFVMFADFLEITMSTNDESFF
jgi:hypothetical protein